VPSYFISITFFSNTTMKWSCFYLFQPRPHDAGLPWGVYQKMEKMLQKLFMFSVFLCASLQHYGMVCFCRPKNQSGKTSHR